MFIPLKAKLIIHPFYALPATWLAALGIQSPSQWRHVVAQRELKIDHTCFDQCMSASISRLNHTHWFFCSSDSPFVSFLNPTSHSTPHSEKNPNKNNLWISLIDFFCVYLLSELFQNFKKKNILNAAVSMLNTVVCALCSAKSTVYSYECVVCSLNVLCSEYTVW